MRNRMIRIFVSSTFNDFKDERDLLVKDVFEKLEDLCREKGFSFQVIDLRWGISVQNSLDNRTLQICFDEIEKCRKLSPRPNFLILSGDRYGWIPLPCSISHEEWEILVGELPEESEERRLLSKWYKQDFNDLKKPYLLQPRRGEYLKQELWDKTEKELEDILFSLAKKKLPEESMVQYGLSATEQEIYHGLFWQKDLCDHKLVVMKEEEAGGQEVKRLREHLRTFSSGDSSPKILTYKKQEGFPLEQIKTHFEKIIKEEMEAITQLPPHEQEHAAVDAELQCVKENYIDVSGNEQKFHAFITQNNGRAVLVTGESGSGKSTMLKHWHTGETMKSVAAFADIQPLCRSTVYALWFCVMELQRNGYLQGVEPMPEADKCVKWFERQLNRIKTQEPIAVILDSVNHMDDWKSLHGSIFQIKIPANVTVVVSCFSKESLAVQDRILEIPTYQMSLLDKQSGIQMLEAKTALAGRCLSFANWTANKEEKKAGDMLHEALPDIVSPLYIQLMSDICCRMHSYDRPEFPGAKTVEELIHLVVEKQSAGNYPTLYHHALGYIALAEEGLSEQEILELLADDEEVCKEIKAQTEWDFKGKVPTVLWARLFIEIQDFLMKIESNGILLYRFRHELLKREIRNIIGDEKLQILASNIKNYFLKQPLTWPGAGKRPVVNTRKIHELYPSLVYIQDWEEISRLLAEPLYSDCLVRCGWYREILLQFQALEQKRFLMPIHIKLRKLMQQRPILLQTWNDSFRQILCSEKIEGSQEWLAEDGKKYFLESQEVLDDDVDWQAETMILSGSAACPMALKDDGTVAVLRNGTVQLIDWKSRALLPLNCHLGTEYTEIYWKNDELIARGEYCRAVMCLSEEALYITKQTTCVSYGKLLKEDGAEDTIEKAGGKRESDVFFYASEPVFHYYTEGRLKKTELFYSYSNSIKVYLQGHMAAVLLDSKRVEIVDLNRRIVLKTWNLPEVSRIFWTESGKEILVSLSDNRILILSADTHKEGALLTGPDAGYIAYSSQKKYKSILSGWQDAMDILWRPSWDGDIPMLSDSDERLPVLAAFSVQKEWIAYYYNYHNRGIIRLFHLYDGKPIADSYVDPVFPKDTVRSALYAAEQGKKLVLVSRGIFHVWNMETLEWETEICEAYPELSEKSKELLRIKYPEQMKKWYPLQKIEKKSAYNAPLNNKIVDAIGKVSATLLSVVALHKVPIAKFDYFHTLYEQLQQLPVYECGAFLVVPNTALGLLHVSDRQGNWICHEQFDAPIWAIDVVEDTIYVLMKNSAVPVVKKLKRAEIL